MKIEIQEGFDTVEVIIKCPENNEEIRRIESLLCGQNKKLPCTKNGVMNLPEASLGVLDHIGYAE